MSAGDVGWAGSTEDGGNDSGVMDEGGQKETRLVDMGLRGFYASASSWHLGPWATALQHWGLPNVNPPSPIQAIQTRNSPGPAARSTQDRLADPAPWLAAACPYKPTTPCRPRSWKPGLTVCARHVPRWCRHDQTARRAAVVSVRKRRRQALGHARAANGGPLGGAIGERGTTHAPSTL